MRRNWIPLAGCVGLLIGAATLATPAQADMIDDQFLSALDSAGVNYQDPTSTAALGQSICPMLDQPGATLASAASSVLGNNGMSPEMAQMFTTIAISTYCPSIMASLADGDMPSLPQLPSIPSI
jgi:hypothetical protein